MAKTLKEAVEGGLLPDEREVLAILRWVASISCDGCLTIWKPPRGMRPVQVAAATCISVKSRRKCMPCRCVELLKRYGE